MSTALNRLPRLADTDFAVDMYRALATSPHLMPPKYFYDAAGSALFDRICDLPEYYPTRTELEILHNHSTEIAAAIGADAEIIEFGAGSLTKIRLLLNALQTPRRYLPLDISGDHLQAAATRLAQDYPTLPITPLIADYAEPFTLPAATGRRIGFFPGSTLGNFTPEDALQFLKRAARLLAGGGLLIGVDLFKDPATLHAAYNDTAGITAAFNLNLLQRANTELNTNFDLPSFAHYAYYNAPQQRIEMHLIARRPQTITYANRHFTLAEGETIHTENSYKFTIPGFHSLARQAGFHPKTTWTDPKNQFSVHWLEA